MSDSSIILCSDELEVMLRGSENPLFSQRFCGAAVVEQVVLHGRHRFCQPEQKRADRVTCNGVGLCSEFVWDQLAGEVTADQMFPKIGVGLLRQRLEGGSYDMWKTYAVEPFPISCTVMPDGQAAVFYQKQSPCLGIEAMMTRTVRVYRNMLIITTELENNGPRTLALTEYQHNFVAIDDMPIGPGYRLSVPFDGTIAGIGKSTVRITDYQTPVLDVMEAEGNTIKWKKPMTETACHKVTKTEQILPQSEYTWSLVCRQAGAKVSETVHFVPEQLVIWGIEHCICPEVYARWQVEPGRRQVFARTWTFEEIGKRGV